MSDLSRGGTLLYKCRVCGEIYGTAYTLHAAATVLWLAREGLICQEGVGTPVFVTSVHNCHSEQVGVTDLVGAMLDEA